MNGKKKEEVKNMAMLALSTFFANQNEVFGQTMAVLGQYKPKVLTLANDLVESNKGDDPKIQVLVMAQIVIALYEIIMDSEVVEPEV